MLVISPSFMELIYVTRVLVENGDEGFESCLTVRVITISHELNRIYLPPLLLMRTVPDLYHAALNIMKTCQSHSNY